MTPINPYLTRQTHKLLRLIRDSEDGELVYNRGGGWWVGTRQIKNCRRLVFSLLRLCLLRYDDTVSTLDKYEVYELNEDGNAVLDNPNHVPRIVEALRKP